MIIKIFGQIGEMDNLKEVDVEVMDLYDPENNGLMESTRLVIKTEGIEVEIDIPKDEFLRMCRAYANADEWKDEFYKICKAYVGADE